MALREIKTDVAHYYTDESGRKQGEYKWWHDNGQIRTLRYYEDDKIQGEFKNWQSDSKLSSHCHYVDDVLHGEYKLWWVSGNLCDHTIYNMGEDMYIDPTTLTDEDRLMLTIKYGFQWLN